METAMMNRVFKLSDSEPEKIPSSGTTIWPLIRTGHISLSILESQPGVEFTRTGHPEEAIVYVLRGEIEYDNERLVRANHAAFNLPNTLYKGKYTKPTRLLVIRVMPWPNSHAPSPNLMERIIRIEDIEPSRSPISGTISRVLVVTENVSVCYMENKPVKELPGPARPEEQVIYVLQGQIEYKNGRLVSAGEAVYNVPNLSRPSQYVGIEPIRFLEILSPPNPKLVVK